MLRGHSDGVRVPTARPFFFFRGFYKSHYGEGEEIRRVVTKRQHRLVWMFDSSTARPFSLFSFADFTNRIMERMGEIQYQFIGKRAERNLCSIEKLHVLAKRKWIDAGGNPVVRHEGAPPSNNLIKDGTHRATVFVGPTLKSFSFYFRRFYNFLYGEETIADRVLGVVIRHKDAIEIWASWDLRRSLGKKTGCLKPRRFFSFSPNLPCPLWR